MSFAIIETGGKQYKVETSKIMNIERVSADKSNLIKFKKVLLLSDDSKTEIGSPNLEGALVEAKLIKNIKDKKILVFHKRRRKHSRKKNGHRQLLSKIQITKILSKDGKVISEFKASVEKKTLKSKSEKKSK